MIEIKIIGIHPVNADEPVHLIEIEATGNDIDWMAITQPAEGADESCWQVPYDEQRVPGFKSLWCFFFHYLDQSRPLSSEAGDLALPMETPAPDHLRFIKYDPP